MRQIFLDVETQKSFDQVGGYKPEKLGVSFVGVVERDGEGVGEPLRFFEEDLPKLWPVIQRADVVIGFNIDDFDLGVLKPYYPGDIRQLPVLDMLARVKESVGYRISLDAIAMHTLGVQKGGSGLAALEYYETKQFEKLAEYCMKDVEITRDVYDYGLTNGIVKFLNKWNRLVEAKVDFTFSLKADSGMQMTLV